MSQPEAPYSGAREEAEAMPRAEMGPEHQSGQAVHLMIAVAAYYRAERRNFEPGHELEDWLDAEAEIRAQTQSLKGFPA